MPIDYSLYPSDWKEISLRIRARANNKCEWCGAVNGLPHPQTGSRVVLTVAHINHDINDSSDSNLAALCQRCHLRHDAKQHAINAAASRLRKRIASGQIKLEIIA